MSSFISLGIFLNAQTVGSSNLFRVVHPKTSQVLSGNQYLEWTIRNTADEYRVLVSELNNVSLIDTTLSNSTLRLELNSGNYSLKIIALANGNIIDSTSEVPFSAFFPNEVDSLSLWVTGDSVIKDNANKISRWIDLSDSNRLVTQSSPIRQPTHIENGLNKHGLVDYTLSRNIFQNAVEVKNKNYYISTLYNYHGALGKATRMITGPSNGSNWVIGPYLKHHLTAGGPFVSNGVPIVQDQFVINSAYSNNDTLFHFVNNNLQGTGPLFNIPGLLSLGNIGNDYMFGSIAEILIYDGSVSSSKRDSIELYLLDKYAPPINLGADQVVCSFPQTISPENSYVSSFLWSDGSVDSSLTVSNTGIYSVTVTDIFGRTSYDSVFFELESSLFLDSLPDDTTICFKDTLDIQLDGSRLFSYQWSDGFVGQNRKLYNPGKYNLTVSDCSGNQVIDSIYVNVNNPVFSLGSDTSICFYDSIILLPDSNFINVNYSWTDGSSGNSLVVQNSGIYSLTVTDNFSCNYADSVTIVSDSILFGLDLGPDTSLCFGNRIGLTQPISGIDSYQWSTGSTDSSVVVNNSQKYFLTVSNNGCRITDSVDILIKGLAPQAGFSYLNQCFMDSIKFLDTSVANGGINIKSWSWNFGDGDTSSIPNPTHYYDTSGTYLVQFSIVNDSNCASSVAFPITIFPKPKANFNNTNFCSEDSILFLNNSTVSFGSIDTYRWDFGDLNKISDTSIFQNPKYYYGSDGNFLVKLSVTSSQGCLDTISKNVLIAPSPVPSFLYVNNYVGDSTRFINTSSISSGTILSYNWDFGNSIISNKSNPKTVYPQLGNYNVSLTANSNLGCIATISDSVNIELRPPPVPSFNIVYPKYNQYVTSNFDFVWNKSDSAEFYSIEIATDLNFQNIIYNKSNILKTNISYSAAIGSFYWRIISKNNSQSIDTSNTGFFNVFEIKEVDSLNLWLTANSGVIDTNGVVASWIDRSDSNIVINQIDPSKRPTLIKNGLNGYDLVDFTANRNTFSNIINVTQKNYFISAIYNFHEASGRPCRFITGSPAGSNWVLGPYLKHHLTSGGPFISNGLPITPGQFVINSSHSIDDSLKHIVNNNLLGIGPKGNIPGLLSLGSLSNEFMNGSVAEIVIINGSVSATVVNDIETSLMDKYSPPINLGKNKTVCNFPQNIDAFKDSYINYQWSTGETDSIIQIDSAGRYLVTVTDIFNRVSVDSIFYILDTTDYQISFSFNDTTICKGNYIDLIAGESNLTYSWNTNDSIPEIKADTNFTYVVSVTNCFGNTSIDSVKVSINNPEFDLGIDTTICFNNSITVKPDSLFNNVSFLWSTGSVLDSILITEKDNYTLTVSDIYGCSFSDSINVNVDSSLSSLGIGPDTSLCRGNLLRQVNPISGINSYLWSNGLNTPTIVLDSSSNYVLTVSKDGCVNSDTALVTIKGNVPTIDFLSNNYCLNDTVVFSDISSPPNGDTLKAWFWNFGDGTTSNSQYPLHRFGSVNSYNVSLMVTTNRGCSDTISKNIVINPLPIADFSIQNNCSKSPIDFIDNSSVSSGLVLGYTWRFGDGKNSNSQNPSHIYDTLGNYSVQLIAETDKGCKDTVSYTKIINPVPAVDFSYFGTCLGDTTKFTDLTIMPKGAIDNYLWGINWLPNPSGNVTSLDSNPQVLIPLAKDVKVSLRVMSDSGCISTHRDTFFINPKPFANFTFDDNCINSNFNINNTSTVDDDSIVLNQFVFRDDTSFVENPIFNSDSVGDFLMSLKVESSNGCADSVSKIVPVYGLPIPDFRILNNNTGIPFTVDISNRSTGANKYIWDFGNGDTSNQELPIYTYRDTGSYNISLKAITENGCLDSISRGINVLPYYLDAAIGDIILSEGNNGFLNVAVQLLNTGNNTIEQIDLVADLNSEFKFQETTNEPIYSRGISGYQFTSSFIQDESNRVNFVCVRIASVNGVQDGELDNNYLCEKGFNENLYVNIFPNPVEDFLNMEYVLPKRGDLRINIYNQNGKQVMESISAFAEEGIYKVQFNTSGLGGGLYHFDFVFEGTKRSGTFVKF